MVRSSVERRSNDCVLVCAVLACAIWVTSGGRGLCVERRKTALVVVGCQWHFIGLDRYGSRGGLHNNGILV